MPQNSLSEVLTSIELNDNHHPAALHDCPAPYQQDLANDNPPRVSMTETDPVQRQKYR